MRMTKLIDKAKSAIAKHPTHAISTSWGKDSVALLHLCASVFDRIVVVNARYPNAAERFADMDRVRDLVLSRPDMTKVNYVEVSTPGEWEMYERAGGGFSEAITAAQKSAVRWWKENFETNMRKAIEKFNCAGVFLGLRADESHARRMNVIMRGQEYTKQNGTEVCLPIAKWSGLNIWSYLVAKELPWLRIYDEASCERERARSGFVFATGGAGAIRRHGVWEDWSRVYPNEFRAWLNKFPELDR